VVGVLIAASGFAVWSVGVGIVPFFSTLLGLYVISLPICIRGARVSLDAVPGLSAERREELGGQLVRLPPRWIATAVLAGFAVHAIASTIAGADLRMSDPGFLATTVIGTLHAPIGGLSFALLLRHGQVFLRAGRNVSHVDLLDHAPLAPFVQQALRSVLFFAIFFGCLMAFHVDWARDLSVAPQVVLMTPVWTLHAACMFALPLWGVHERLRGERRAELVRVHAAIRGDRNALRSSIVAADADALTAVDLLQYRTQVEALGTWPFGTATLVRLGAYLFIPLASWVGGALVERVVDVVLE
jgi:hypothetical protein